MAILYALVSREKTVLAEHTATSASGNFATVTRVLLAKIPKNDGKMTYGEFDLSNGSVSRIVCV